MHLGYYQYLCSRTMKPDTKREATIHFALGLAGEVGEVVEPIKKGLFYSDCEIDSDQIKDELGDVLWNIAALAQTLDISLEDIAEWNLFKLKARYPEKFERGD